MAQRVCPWWLGYFLASPLRRLLLDPGKAVAPYVREGMTVFEPGPGMGFFTLELARRVGPRGKVVAVDIQPRMLRGLRKRAAKAGLLDRIDARLATSDSMGLADLAGTIDFVLAFAVVHELPSAKAFFREAAEVLRPGACLQLVEPSGHVKPAQFQEELDIAATAGLTVAERPTIRGNHAALLRG